MTAVHTYLDYNATAPVRPPVAEAVARALALTGNPSSIHGPGRTTRRLLEDSRDAIAALTGAASDGVIFTSGATEANALALSGWQRPVILASAVEHASIAEGAVSRFVPVDRHGVIDLAVLGQMLAETEQPVLLALMLANNETGVIQPVAEAAKIAKVHGALVHCDAVQAAGRLPIDIRLLGVDSLALSAHKMGGAPGIGALVLADGQADLQALWKGGGQERKRRSGTENVPGIAGFAAVARLAAAEIARQPKLAVLRDRLESDVKRLMPTAVIFSEGANRLGNTSCIAVPGMTAQTLLMALDLAQVAVSAGSACSSGKLAPSRVVAAMGYPELAAAAIRVSFGWASQDSDVDHFLAAFAAIVVKMRGHAA
jgi:cysteine desulfurase